MATAFGPLAPPIDEDERLFRQEIRDTLMSNDQFLALSRADRVSTALRFSHQQIEKRAARQQRQRDWEAFEAGKAQLAGPGIPGVETVDLLPDMPAAPTAPEPEPVFGVQEPAFPKPGLPTEATAQQAGDIGRLPQPPILPPGILEKPIPIGDIPHFVARVSEGVGKGLALSGLETLTDIIDTQGRITDFTDSLFDKITGLDAQELRGKLSKDLGAPGQAYALGLGGRAVTKETFDVFLESVGASDQVRQVAQQEQKRFVGVALQEWANEQGIGRVAGEDDTDLTVRLSARAGNFAGHMAQFIMMSKVMGLSSGKIALAKNAVKFGALDTVLELNRGQNIQDATKRGVQTMAGYVVLGGLIKTGQAGWRALKARREAQAPVREALKVLGLKWGATPDQIQKAFRQKAKAINFNFARSNIPPEQANILDEQFKSLRQAVDELGGKFDANGAGVLARARERVAEFIRQRFGRGAQAPGALPAPAGAAQAPPTAPIAPPGVVPTVPTTLAPTITAPPVAVGPSPPAVPTAPQPPVQAAPITEKQPWEMTKEGLHKQSFIAAEEHAKGKTEFPIDGVFYHVVPAEYGGGDLVSRMVQENRGTFAGSRWEAEGDMEEYTAGLDAYRVTLTTNFPEAFAFNEDYEGGKGHILKIQIPAQDYADLQEFDEIQVNAEGYPTLSEVPDAWITEVSHEALVRKALAEGQLIPPEVLAEYPNLAPPAPPPETVAPPTQQAAPIPATGPPDATPVAQPEAINDDVYINNTLANQTQEYGTPFVKVEPTTDKHKRALAALQNARLKGAIYKTDSAVSGFVDPDRPHVVFMRDGYDIARTVGHEISHALEDLYPDLHEQLMGLMSEGNLRLIGMDYAENYAKTHGKRYYKAWLANDKRMLQEGLATVMGELFNYRLGRDKASEILVKTKEDIDYNIFRYAAGETVDKWRLQKSITMGLGSHPATDARKTADVVIEILDKLRERGAATVRVTPPSTPAVAAPKPSEAPTGVLPTPKAPEAVEGEPERAVAGQKQPWEMTKEEAASDPRIRLVTDLGETIARVDTDGKVVLTDAFFGHGVKERQQVWEHEVAHDAIDPAEDRFWHLIDSGAIGKYNAEKGKWEGVTAGRNPEETLTNLAAKAARGEPVPPEFVAAYPDLAPAAKPAEAEKPPEKPPRPPTLLAAEARARKKISDAGTVLRAQLAEQKKTGKPLREQLKKEEVVSQKAFREGQKDITNLHGALQQFINKNVTKQGQHRKRLSEAISKARTPTELKIVGERVIATAEAFALGEESVLTDEQLDELKTTEQMKGQRKGFRIGKLDTKAKQTDLIKFIEEHLPLSERGQLLRTLKNTVNEKTLGKAREAVERVHARWDKRTAIEDYNKAEKAAKKAVGGPHRNPQVAAPVIDRLATVLDNFVTSKPTQETLDTLEATVDAEVFYVDIDFAQDIESQLSTVKALKALDAAAKKAFLLRRDAGYQLAKTKAAEALDAAAKKILVKEMPPGHIRVLTQFIQRTLHEAKRTGKYKVQGEARDLQNDVDATLPQMEARGEIKFPGEAVAGVSRERSGLPRVYWDNAIDAHRFFLDYTAIADSIPDRLYKGILSGMNEQKGWLKLSHEMVIGRLRGEGIDITKNWILSHRNRSNQAWFRRQVAKVKGPDVKFTDVKLPAIKGRGVPAQTMKLDPAAKSYLAAFLGDPDNLKQIMRKGYKGLSFPGDPWTFYPMNSERVNAIQDSMNGEDLAVMNAIRDFLNGPMREGAQEGFQAVRGHPFVELPNHFARFANRDMGGGKRSDPLEVLRNTKINADGRLSERTGGQSHFIMDIWDVLFSQTTALSRWASLAEPLDSMARFFRVPSIYENNTKRFGPNKQGLLQNYMESVGGVIPYQPTSLPQRAFRFFKGKRVGAALGINPRVWFLQRFSQPLVAWKLDAEAAVYGAKAMVKQPKGLNEELDEMVPWAWSRRHLQSGAQIMTPLSARSDSVESLMLGDVEQHFGFKQISKNDRRAIVGVWQSTKEWLLRQENQSKLLETDARQWPEDIQEKLVAKFLEVATDTQPTFDIETLSGFQREARRDAFVGSIMAFMSVRTKVTSMYAEEYMRLKTGQITGPEATARVGSLAALFHGTNLVTKWGWRLLLAGLPAALLLRIFGGDEKKYKAWQESQIDDKKTIAGTTTRAVSEVLSTLPGGNVAGALLWQLAKALESRWNRPATVADANIVLDALDDVGRAVDKTVKAVQASGEFERGKHKGEARWKVKTTDAADQWAEALDGVLFGAGYSGVRQIVGGIKANYDALGFEESEENIRDAYKRYVLDAAKGLKAEEDSKRRTELADRARAVGLDAPTMLSKARKWLKKRETK